MRRLATILFPVPFALACSGTDTPATQGSAGATSIGGSSASTGGTLAGAGTSASLGGALAVGGITSTSTGGNAVTTGGSNAATGGSRATGGSVAATGGTTATGGTKATGGTTAAAGGTLTTGGTKAVGGTSSPSGGTATGGTHATGGTATITGGASTTGGSKAAGGTASTGGSAATGGAGGTGTGGTGNGSPPGDICASAGTPLVAAHSMTRAMYASYSGKLFQVRRPTDSKTQDISVTAAGAWADVATLTSFCTGTTCTVVRLYDQSGNGNDMWQNTVANQPTINYWTASDGTKWPIVVSKGYQWLRNRTQTKKIPTGSNPQTEYFVVHGAYAGRAAGTNGCCYDYGNMETNIVDDGPGTMTALYFGDATDWTRGAGSGPWVMLDMENGVFAGGGSIAILNAGSASVNPNDPSLKYPGNNIVTGLAKTDGKSTFALKYGNAASGTLSTAWNGSLPTNRNPTSYIPLQQQGGLSLGEGGDGSAMGTGAFSEGVVIAAQTTDATDSAIQANLVSVYGR